MLADPKKQLTAVMQSDLVKISPEINLQVLPDHPGWLEYKTLPVVDRSGTFLGAIRSQTVLRIQRALSKTATSGHALAAGNALGELYRIGLAGLIRSAVEITTAPEK
jgi:Mg/Co/Ni transporter MgtE